MLLIKQPVPLRLAHWHGRAFVGVNRYAVDGSIAIQLYDAVDGDPLARATVMLEGADLEGDEVCIKSWSENEGMAKALMEAGIIGPIKRIVPAGFSGATVHDLLHPIPEGA